MKPVTVVTHKSFPPFGEVPSAGEPRGFEIDIVREVCRRTGLTPSWVGMELDEALKTIAKNERVGDVVSFSATSPNDERRKMGIIFGTPYFMTKRQLYSVAGRRVDAQAPESIAVVQGSKFGIAAKQYYPRARLLEFATSAEAHKAMVDGRAQCMITLLPELWDEVKAGKVVELSETLALDGDVGASPAYSTHSAAAFRAAIDGALSAMLAEGWINALAKRLDLPFFQPVLAGVSVSLRAS